MIPPASSPLLAVLLGAAFVAAAVPKLLAPRHFLLTVVEFDLLPPSVARPVSLLLPPAELVVGIATGLGLAGRTAAVIAACMLCAFLVAIAVNVARRRQIDCGCFGSYWRREAGWSALTADAGLLCIALFLAASGTTWLGPDPWTLLRATVTHSLDLVTLLTLGTIFTVAIVFEVRRLHRRPRANAGPPAPTNAESRARTSTAMAHRE